MKIMNDTERSLWVDNDETLYLWWRASRLPKRAFISAYRARVDSHINAVLGRKPCIPRML